MRILKGGLSGVEKPQEISVIMSHLAACNDQYSDLRLFTENRK